jgi:hypothetical protein
MYMNLGSRAGRGRRLIGSAAIAEFPGFALPPYTGLIATCVNQPTEFADSNKQFMNRTVHHARDDITSMRLLFPNYYVDSSFEEVGPGADATIKASVEYPAGVIHRVQFSESDAGTIPDGGLLLSDALTGINIPRGARFWVRTYYTNTAGLVYTPNVDGVSQYAASGISDQTGGGDVVDQAASFLGYGPVAIIGSTIYPSVAVIGDSRVAGNDDTMDVSGDIGSIRRSLAPHFAYAQLAKSGDKIEAFLADNTNRVAIASYASHVVIQQGINDLTGGRTASQVKGDLESAAALFTGKTIIGTTKEPVSSSTDDFATLGNQTTDASNDERVDLNGEIRAGNIAGFDDYFEIADAVESARDSGLWIVNGEGNYFTSDGLHAERPGHLVIQDWNGVDPKKIWKNLLPPQPRFATQNDMADATATGLIVSPAMLLSGLRQLLPFSWDFSTGVAAINLPIADSVKGRFHVFSQAVTQTPATSADELVLEGNDTGLTILSANNTTGSVFFGDDGAPFAGYLQYNHASDFMRFGINATERARLNVEGLKIGGTASRATTAGTNALHIFNGTAPAGTLTNGCSLYSTSGEMRVMDAAGNATLISPHDRETNEWVYDSINTRTGKRLRIDMEKMMRFLNEHHGLDFVKEMAVEE